MNTCTSSNHPNTAVVQTTGGPCPYCAALVELDVLLKIRVLLSMPGADATPEPVKASKPDKPDLPEKPATRGEAFNLLSNMKTGQRNALHRQLVGPVRRGSLPADLIYAIQDAWFPVTEPPTDDTEGENGSETAHDPEEDPTPTEPPETPAETLRRLKGMPDWATLAQECEKVTGQRPAMHMQEVQIRGRIMAKLHGTDRNAGEE